ncbi:hypothetical protein L218DRAFT_1080257 [Marasmius fiardii PR-910]|nr:hypothetical protein L218DRAFT_1080257 [Marasmius fiardii PR-910]
MEGAKGQVSLLNESIVSLRAVIASMKEERSRLRKEIGEFRWILRPIQRFSPELLGRIFAFAVDSSIPKDPFLAPSSLHPIGMSWVLANVCQPWRKLALTTPNLWNCISLALPTNQGNPRVPASTGPPSDLTVTTLRRPFPPDMDPLLLLLYLQSHRWKTLHIELDNKDAPTISLIRGRLPLLEHLYVRCIERPLMELDCFEFAPRLRVLAISGEVQQYTPGFPLKLPNGQVKHFYYDNPSSMAIYSVCRMALNDRGADPDLQTCRLSLDSTSIHHFWQLRRCHPRYANLILDLPYLTQLELNHTEKKSGIEITLFWIKTGSLKNLTIFSTGPDRAPFVEMPADEFSAVLDLLTGLEILKFGVQKGITNDHLELIYDTTSTSFSIILNLQTLALLPTEGVESQYGDEVLANLLDIRWRGLSEPGSSSQPQPSNHLLSVEVDRRIVDER